MHFGFTNINIFFDGWWTLFIIIPSFIELIRSDGKIGSLIGLIIGTVLLLCCQGYLSFSIIGKLIFPFILVMIGLSLIFKDTINKKVSDKIRDLNANKGNLEEYCATFGGQQANFNGEEFKRSKFRRCFW